MEEDAPQGMFKLISKERISTAVQESILGLEERGTKALGEFVSERVCGEKNLWDRMTKSKYISWESSSRKMQIKSKIGMLSLRATTSTMARLLIIARSMRGVDLQDVIGQYEFTTVNQTVMEPDGSVHPTHDKSDIMHMLEDLVTPDDAQQLPPQTMNEVGQSEKCIIIDGMAAVVDVYSVQSFENCKDLADEYVNLIEAKAKKYSQARVIFYNYSYTESLKEPTRELRRGGKAPAKGYIVEDATKIKNGNTKVFLASAETKDSLTKYLAQVLVRKCCVHVITATRFSVLSNRTCSVFPGVSTQEEADTLLIWHAVDAHRAGFTVHIYSQDTDVLLLALRRVPELGSEAAMLMKCS